MGLGSAQVTVGTQAVLLASVPANTVPGVVGYVLLLADATVDAYIGGVNVSTTNGLKLTHAVTTPVTVPLSPGEALYGIVASSTATIGVLQT